MRLDSGTMGRPTLQDTRSSLSRGLSLLDMFTPERTELSVRELARASGVPRSTTHRLVRDLLAWGALEQGQVGVRLGVKLFELGTIAPAPSTLREAATPLMHTLAEVTGLTANLAIREGSDIVYLDKISRRSLRVPHSRLGGRGQLHATALGKAILAFSSEDVVAAALAAPLPSLTVHTIIEPALVRRALRVIRRETVAYDIEESLLGLFCVAAPILDVRRRPLGAISVTGATGLAQAQRFAPVVMATARSISRTLFPHAGVLPSKRSGHHVLPSATGDE